MAIQPAGVLASESGAAIGSVPALRNVIAGDVSSGFVWTAVVDGSGVAASVAAKARSAADRRRLVFIGRMSGDGGGLQLGARSARGEKERGDLFRRKLFHRAQRDSLQPERADLVAGEAFHVVTERSEEQADFALLAVVHMHVEAGAGAINA